MKKMLVAIAAVFFVAASATMASALVVTFDDVVSGGYGSGSSTQGTIQDGYAGLDWSEFGYLDTATYGTNSGYLNSMVSGTYVAFNEYAQVATVSDFGFRFAGAYFTAAWNDGLNIDVVGTDIWGHTVSTSFIVNTDGPTLVEFGWNNLASLEFTSSGGTANPNFPGGSGAHFAMDNFVINQCQVPEPATMLLFGTGLAGLAGLARRRKEN